MGSTLLQLVNRAQSEMGLPASSTVISNTTASVIQQLNLINGVGNDLVREKEWQGITKLHTFTTVFYEYTATLTADSTTITVLSDTTGLTTNPTYFLVQGAGIPNVTTLVSVDSGASTAVLSRAVETSGTAVELTFIQVIYTMPSDFDRIIDSTQWDKTQNWAAIGPDTAQEWNWLQSGWVTIGPGTSFRILGDKFQIYPPIVANDYLTWEYVSNQWVATSSSASPSKSSFTVDTDVCVFPDRLMIDGLKMYFAQSVGLPWEGYAQAWTRQLSISKHQTPGPEL